MVRIVYDGPPTAGKTTTLRSLAERFGQGRVYTPEETAGRTVYFDWLEYTGGRFEGRPIRCQILSVPGQRVLGPRRQRLLETADAVVFVADTSRDGLPESVRRLEQLRAELAARVPKVGVVLQANKRDVPDAAPLDPLRGQKTLAVIESVASAGEGIREAFVFAVRLALDHVREQLQSGPLEITPPDDTAERLFDELRALPLDPTAFERWAAGPVVERPPTIDQHLPRLPDAAVPPGSIWPPVQGRVLLQQVAGEASAPRELTPDEWAADIGPWRFHSAASQCFEQVEEGRAALVRWAQQHAALGPWLSPRRCIVLCQNGDGRYRLWQVVRHEQTLWNELTAAVESREPTRISARFSEASTWAVKVSQHWATAPWELPCTLETIGVLDGAPAFVGFLPDGERATGPLAYDRAARLRQQLKGLLDAELGPMHALLETG